MSFVPLIPDEPCAELGLLPERQSLLKQIAHAVAYSEPPLVVGVHGDWGAGKTSFLHSLQYHLTGRCPQNATVKKKKSTAYPHVAAVWFEAWRHQHEPIPLIALLHEIRSQLTFTENPAKHVLEKVKKYGLVAIDGALRTFDHAVGAVAAHYSGLPIDPRVKIGVVESVRAAGEAYEADTLATSLPSQKVRDHLKEAVNLLLPTGPTSAPDSTKQIQPRLIVFVDDLDRCEPETTLRLLEGIKVYLNLPNCVFVLGLNQREVERALAKVMPSGKRDADQESAELMIRAHEYLEKICANVWHLPRISPRRQLSLLRHWLSGKLPQDFLEAVISLLEKHEFLPANARRIKAFANTLLRCYHSRVNEADLTVPSPTEASMLCIIASLQQFHPRLWRHVESEPEFLLELQQFSRGSLGKIPTPKDTLRRAKDLHPELVALELPHEGNVDPKGSVAFTTRFADLAYGNVLHNQRLLASFEFSRDYLMSYLG